jgi:hypothetical protein
MRAPSSNPAFAPRIGIGRSSWVFCNRVLRFLGESFLLSSSFEAYTAPSLFPGDTISSRDPILRWHP